MFGMGAIVSQAVSPPSRSRMIWAISIGNALEWFDFTVFGQFALTIGKLFFPESDPNSQLLASFAIFGSGFVARPIGGLFFGTLADRIGRKRVLVLIVLLMGSATAAMGLLPTYSMVGIFAPLGLLITRLLQGLSAGGDFGPSTTLLLESAGSGRRGFFASFQYVAQALALVLGAAIGALLNHVLSPEALQTWGWRAPFILGAVAGPVGFYLRRNVQESPEFTAFVAARGSSENSPLGKALSRHWRALLAGFFIIGGSSATIYTMNILLPNFATKTLRLDLASAQLGVLVTALVVACLLPAAGLASDRLGRRALMAPGAIAFIAIAVVLAERLISTPTIQNLWMLQAAGLVSVFFLGPMAALLTEIFPIDLRSTGSSIVYNCGVITFGGFAPYIGGWLVNATGNFLSPFYYLIGCLILALFGLFILPDDTSVPV